MATQPDPDLSNMTICSACFCQISSCYLKIPDCIGILTKCNCLCCECFDSCGLVAPQACCSTQQQCFCVDHRCAFPCTNAVPYACSILPFCLCFPYITCCPTLAEILPGDAEPSKLNVDPSHLFVLLACLCAVHSLYFKIPDCVGCAGFNTFLCLHCEFYQKITWEFITCYKSVGHCCCLDSRLAIPCDEDVPFACTVCPFFLVLPTENVGCCVKISDLGYHPPPYPTMVVAVPIYEGHHVEDPTQNLVTTQPMTKPVTEA